jgi:WD40 repeat protein
MVYDSKDDLESITSQDPLWGQFFNSTDDELEFMNRSDDKGPEPEGVITGVIGDKTYAFVILERIGGVVAYDISNPMEPQFIQYLNNRDPEDGEAGDLAPEGILFVKAEDSPTGGNLLVISNEVSGTITVITLDELEQPVAPDCEDLDIFLADILEDGVTNIYGVELVEDEAQLEYIATSEIEVHIAYNETDHLIYAVSKADGSYRTLDPNAETPEFGEVNMLSTPVEGITQAVFNQDGKLLIGSQETKAIYSVMIDDNSVSVYDSYTPIQGGDLVVDGAGALYAASRLGFGSLYKVFPDEIMEDILLGSVPAEVTGLALMSNGNFLVSHRDANTLMVRGINGAAFEPYNITLDGEPFFTMFGDMASGCASDDDPNQGEECEYSLYYVHSPQGGGRELFEVTLNEDGTATTTSIFNNPPNAHIGITPDGSTLYMVGNSNVNTFDIASATVTNTADIVSVGGMDLASFPAAVVDSDGTLYAASSQTNQVYTVDPVTGTATPFGPSVNVNGGDLIFAPTGDEGADELWILTRNNNTFTRVLDGTSFTVPVTEINGAAVLQNGNVLLADGNGEGLLKEIDLSDPSTVAATYETGLELFNGDLAGVCVPLEEGDDGEGDDEEAAMIANGNNSLTSFPNPTEGLSQVVFSSEVEGRVTVEVYDLNGRLVETLFNQDVEAGVEYRVDFNGLRLPNGVYVYKMTSLIETTVEKFMIAR